MRIDSPPKLAGNQVYLRPLDATDIDNWFAYLSIPSVVEHTSWSLESSNDLQALLDIYNSASATSEIRFAICKSDDASFVGTIGFHSISHDQRIAELAYDLDPSVWGQGVASACCSAVTDWGFESRGYGRINATVLETNLPSVRVLEKCGYKLDGLLRNHRMVRGTQRDFLLFTRSRIGT